MKDDKWQPIEIWRTGRAGGPDAWTRVSGLGPSPGPPGADVMAFDPADTALAIGSEHNALISLTGGRNATGSFGASDTGVQSLAFNRSGTIIATGFSDVGVALWNAATGARIRQLAMPGQQVTALAFSPDDRFLAVGGDGLVSLWDVASGRPLGGPYEPGTGAVLSLAFTPDGRRLRSLAEDGVSRTYPIDPRAALDAVCARMALYGRDCPS
jgi:WD40 repeat protein